MLVGRYKDGVRRHRRAIRVSADSHCFNKQLAELRELHVPGERIYACAAQRNMTGAVRDLKERMLANDYDQYPDWFYTKLDKRWVSCVMSATLRRDVVWLADLDTEREEAHFRAQYDDMVEAGTAMPIIHEYQTKNGLHIVISPFDIEGLEEETVSYINRNPLLLWSY